MQLVEVLTNFLARGPCQVATFGGDEFRVIGLVGIRIFRKIMVLFGIEFWSQDRTA